MRLPRILNPTKWFGGQNRNKSWLSFGGGTAGWRNNPQWFQMGDGPPSSHDAMQVSTVYACVKLISEEMARLNINHLKEGEHGGQEKIKSSAFHVLRNPNRYQTRSDFILYTMMQLLLTGNCYAIATRDKRGAINSLHPLPGRSCTPHIVQETGEIFYHFTSFDLSKSEIGDGTMVPQRDVLHIRLFTPTHPLIGQSPLVAAALGMATQQSIKNNVNEFFANMGRPAGLLTTPKPLPVEAAKRLKKAWEDAQNGKTPILDNDIKYQSFTMNAVDSDLVSQFNLSVKEIASVFRVPIEFLGEAGELKFKSLDESQRWFIRSTLGFYLSHVENAFEKFFAIKVDENILFDLESGMMRSDLKTRMEALSKGVAGGILTPNEGREFENRKPVSGGDKVYMQRQNWPIDMLGEDVDKPVDNGTSSDDNMTEEDDEKVILEMTNYLAEKTLEAKAA